MGTKGNFKKKRKASSDEAVDDKELSRLLDIISSKSHESQCVVSIDDGSQKVPDVPKERLLLPSGCGVGSVTNRELEVLQGIHWKIDSSLKSYISWGESKYDRRARGYGYILNEGNKYNHIDLIKATGIKMHSEYEDTKHRQLKAQSKHEFTMNNCFCGVHLTNSEIEVIDRVVEATKEILYVHRDQLQEYEFDSIDASEIVAIQPNIHHGQRYLPLHLDMPRHDGFGIVIVTIALWGSGDIVIVDDGDPGTQSDQSSWVFPLHPGQFYMLSGHSRNKCAHGVVMKAEDCSESCEKETISTHDRISMNIRFGVHTIEQADRDINRHWEE